MQAFVLFVRELLHMQQYKQRDGWAASALQSCREREAYQDEYDDSIVEKISI